MRVFVQDMHRADERRVQMSINYRGLNIPFVSFGAVTSDDLFCDNEQVIFDFYTANKDRYHRALDIGANIGVHSILMARQGWDVKAFEPDLSHFNKCVVNVGDHGYLDNCIVYCRAVSDHNGTETFVRVKGNTTGSHLKGDKQSYGELEEFEVNVVDCRPLFDWADFAKIDCEGRPIERAGAGVRVLYWMGECRHGGLEESLAVTEIPGQIGGTRPARQAEGEGGNLARRLRRDLDCKAGLGHGSTGKSQAPEKNSADCEKTDCALHHACHSLLSALGVRVLSTHASRRNFAIHKRDLRWSRFKSAPST